MKPNSTKSQITMLMIIGLVLFIAISLVLYLSKYAIKKQSKQNTDEAQYDVLETQPIKEFVAKCLDKLSKDAIILLGKQGGYIYTSQGGTLVDYRYTDEGIFFVKPKDNNGNTVNVVYDILPPRFIVSDFSSIVPQYPWEKFPEDSNDLTKEKFDGYFGINEIPPLNSSGGPHSIKTQIETFVDNNMASCADFSVFKKQDLDVVMNPAKTSVIIGASDVTIKSKIHISITNPKTNQFAEVDDFSTNVNIRLKDIYFFTKELIDKDVGDIKFNISDIKNNKDGLKVQLIQNVYSNDDLIIVTDEKSLIYGKPFEYVFARKNRAPALYYITKNVLEFPPDYEIKESDLLQGQELKAEDPDEDSYTFSIYLGEFSKNPAIFPITLKQEQIKFRVEVSDDKLLDYQIITVNRI